MLGLSFRLLCYGLIAILRFHYDLCRCLIMHYIDNACFYIHCGFVITHSCAHIDGVMHYYHTWIISILSHVIPYSNEFLTFCHIANHHWSICIYFTMRWKLCFYTLLLYNLMHFVGTLFDHLVHYFEQLQATCTLVMNMHSKLYKCIHYSHSFLLY